ncbi:MAG: hypothetical protein IJJ57_11220 [Ruminococcus sp.]|nr:hypothetical protein [Ruminococcus sp.]
MAKYKIIYHWTDGTEDEDDNYGEYWDSEAEANEAGLYGLSCAKQGGMILEMSNPGDYPFDESDYEDDWFEVVEIS